MESDRIEGMRAFANRYKVSLNDPDLRRMYDYEMSAQRDQASRDYSAKMGTVAYTVRKMLNDGFPVEAIYQYVDASRADVDSIIAKVRSENNNSLMCQYSKESAGIIVKEQKHR